MTKTKKDDLESRTKLSIRLLMEEYGCYDLPVAMGLYGDAGHPDDIICFKGIFLAIEAKRCLRWGDKSTLPKMNQIKMLDVIRKCGGVSLVVDSARLCTLKWVLREAAKMLNEGKSEKSVRFFMQTSPVGWWGDRTYWLEYFRGLKERRK